MVEINTQFNRLAKNINKLRSSRFALGIDESGELMRLGFKGKVAQALVDLGIAKQGKWGARLAVALAGKENFELLGQSAETRLNNSLINVIAVVKKLETRGLDSDLSKQVERKIDKTMSIRNVRLTSADFKDLHNTIHTKVIPPRRAYRALLAEKMEAREATPTMQGATYRGIAIAVAALRQNMEKKALPIGPPTIIPPIERGSGISVAPKADGPSMPVDVLFAEKVCGKNWDNNLLNRDIWDANRILGELRAAELHVREEADRIEEDPEVSQEDFIKAKTAVLKKNLLTSLEVSFTKKRALSKAPGEITAEKITGEAISTEAKSDTSKAVKSAFKDKTSSKLTEAKPKRSIRFGGVKVAEIEKSYLSANFDVNDTNREQWAHAIWQSLNDSKGPQVPHEVAKALARRGKHGKDDPETMKAISFLRAHPVFLEKENFRALYTNVSAAREEYAVFPDKFSAESKENYRQYVDAYRELTWQVQSDTKDLMKRLDVYEAGLKKLNDVPPMREAQLHDLNQQLGPYKEYVESYEEVFDKPADSSAVGYGLGGKRIRSINEIRRIANSTKIIAESILEYLEKDSLFVDE